jgi:hypothetical protein
MAQPDAASIWAPRRIRTAILFGVGSLADIKGVEIVAEGHEHAAMHGVFLRNSKAEHITIEPLGDFLVGDAEIDVADPFELDHFALPLRHAAYPLATRETRNVLPNTWVTPSRFNSIGKGRDEVASDPR